MFTFDFYGVFAVCGCSPVHYGANTHNTPAK